MDLWSSHSKSSWSQAIRKRTERLKKEGNRNQAPETIYLIYAIFTSKMPMGKRVAKIQPDELGRCQLWPTGSKLSILPLSYSEVQGESTLGFPAFNLKDRILPIASISCEPQSSLLRNQTFPQHSLVPNLQVSYCSEYVELLPLVPIAVPLLSDFSRLDLTLQAVHKCSTT